MGYIDRMKAQDYIDKTREYLNYLEEHINNVKKAFTELSIICKKLPIVIDDFSWHTLRGQIIYHDISKFSKEEFVQYRQEFYPVNNKEKNSDFKLAWENHKKENLHHHEVIKNNLDVFHMVVDWTAMGYKFGDTAQEYYEKNKNKIKLSKEHKDFMYEIFNTIKNKSE